LGASRLVAVVLLLLRCAREIDESIIKDVLKSEYNSNPRKEKEKEKLQHQLCKDLTDGTEPAGT
jgi:hypothetical protein